MIDSETGNLVQTPSWKLVSDSTRLQEDAEHLRKLYVALTRAQHFAVLIGRNEKRSGGGCVTSWKKRLNALLESSTDEDLGIRRKKETDIKKATQKKPSLVKGHPEILRLQTVSVEAPDASSTAESLIRSALDPGIRGRRRLRRDGGATPWSDGNRSCSAQLPRDSGLHFPAG